MSKDEIEKVLHGCNLPPSLSMSSSHMVSSSMLQSRPAHPGTHSQTDSPPTGVHEPWPLHLFSQPAAISYKQQINKMYYSKLNVLLALNNTCKTMFPILPRKLYEKGERNDEHETRRSSAAVNHPMHKSKPLSFACIQQCSICIWAMLYALLCLCQYNRNRVKCTPRINPFLRVQMRGWRRKGEKEKKSERTGLMRDIGYGRSNTRNYCLRCDAMRCSPA